MRLVPVNIRDLCRMWGVAAGRLGRVVDAAVLEACGTGPAGRVFIREV